MIGVAITQAAFNAIAATLPVDAPLSPVHRYWVGEA